MRPVEESLALLRGAPARAWALYLLGAAPFAIGLIWFWLETTRSAYARRNLAFSSGAVALLFLWKQVSESLFLAELRATLGGQPAAALSARLLARLALRQAAVQPSSLLAVPFAVLALFPLPHTLLFYRHFSLAAADPEAPRLRDSLEPARFGGWGPQWTLMTIAGLAALLLYVNLLAFVLIAAQLASGVFGVEGLEFQVGALLRNTTVHFSIGVAVYLSLDLLFDAAAALQAFQAVSQRSGEDILAALRRSAALAAMTMLVFALGVPVVSAQAPTRPVDPPALDRAIDNTLAQPEFAWRLEPGDADLPPFVKAVVEALRAADRKMDEWIEAIRRWLDVKPPAVDLGREGPAPPVRQWMVGAGVVVAVGLVVLAFRSRRGKAAQPAEPRVAANPIDVRDESVLASNLPEAEWLRLAERFVAEGEPRLALRALHLACLRILSERGLVAVARSKTGFDYLEEVRRRSRGQPALAERFQENVGLFEFGWYSLHPVGPEMVDSYRRGLEQIRAYAA